MVYHCHCSMRKLVYDEINYFLGLDPECHLIPDFKMHIKNVVLDSGLPVLGIFVGSLVTVALISFCTRSRLVSIFLLLAAMIGIGLTIWKYDPLWALIGHTIMNALVAAMWSLLVTVADKYPSCAR
jgi:hypothetical protein